MSSAIEARPFAGEPKSNVRISPLAGKPAPREMQVEVAKLEREYFARRPDLDDRNQLVRSGTSGHRGSSLNGAFTEAHVLAITQAICDYRRGQGIDGPLFYIGKDTHALSTPAQCTAIEVLAANRVQTVIQRVWRVYKIYAESFGDQSHLDALVNEAQEIVNNALR
jgi:phosphoglucomutase